MLFCYPEFLVSLGALCPVPTDADANAPGTFKASERPQSHRLPVTQRRRGATLWLNVGVERIVESVGEAKNVRKSPD